MVVLKGLTRRGFSLVEVTIAIAILAFALVVLLGLLPTGLQTNQVAIQQAQALNLLSGIKADLAAAGRLQGPQTESPYYGIQLDFPPANSGAPATYFLNPAGRLEPGAAAEDDAAAEALLRVTLGEIPPGAHGNQRLLRVQVTWPPMAGPEENGLISSAQVAETALIVLPP